MSFVCFPILIDNERLNVARFIDFIRTNDFLKLMVNSDLSPVFCTVANFKSSFRKLETSLIM